MTPIKLAAYRRLATELLAFACDGPKGRDEHDAVYREITEGRDGPSPQQMAKYSSCADLAHWLYYRLGFREDWINREECHGWVVGANLNRWCPVPIGPNRFARKPEAIDFNPMAGDVIVINNAYGGHVLCVQYAEIPNDTPSPEQPMPMLDLWTAEYGQPGGMQKAHSVWPDGRGGLLLGKPHTSKGGNSIISHVRLDVALLGCEAWLEAVDVEVLRGYQADEVLVELKEALK